MKYLILLIFPLLISCQNKRSCKQNEFDLASLSFPLYLKDIREKFKIPEKGNYSLEVVTYVSNEPKIVFNCINLTGNISEYNKNLWYSNNVEFYEDDKTKQINAFRIKISTAEEVKELDKFLESKFGTTDFYYKNQEHSFQIWETSDKLYFFVINNAKADKTAWLPALKLASLYIINSACRNFNIEPFQSGNFKFYQSYLEEKDKSGNNKLTYKEFAEKTGGFYLEDYVR